MVRLAERTCVYLVGLSVLGVGLVLFTIGFATPNWIEHHYMTGSSFFGTVAAKSTLGLWQLCSSSLGVTVCLSFNTADAAYNVARSFECITLIIFVLYGIIAFMHNFTSITNSNLAAVNRLLTILAILGGVLGILGAVVFIATHASLHLSWSIGLVIAGCVLAIIGSILMAFFPTSHLTTSAGNNGVVFQATQYPMGANQPQIHMISTTNQNNQYVPPPGRAQRYAVA